MESHHLVPIAKQVDFDVNIDVPENIICLCPNCHRAFHSSELEYRNRLIEKFYLKRKEKLKSRGITVDVDTLKEYYNTI
jgi:5-methylcytosine-specific restriction protein A